MLKIEKGQLPQNGCMGRGEASQKKTLNCYRQADSCTSAGNEGFSGSFKQ